MAGKSPSISVSPSAISLAIAITYGLEIRARLRVDLRPMYDIDEKTPTWSFYIWNLPLFGFLFPSISGGFSDNDYRETVENFMPFVIIWALLNIIGLLLAIAIECAKMNAKTKKGRGD